MRKLRFPEKSGSEPEKPDRRDLAMAHNLVPGLEGVSAKPERGAPDDLISANVITQEPYSITFSQPVFKRLTLERNNHVENNTFSIVLSDQWNHDIMCFIDTRARRSDGRSHFKY